MGSNAGEDTWENNAKPVRRQTPSVPAEHAARWAAHNVEHVERNTNAGVAHCATHHGDGRLTIRQKS